MKRNVSVIVLAAGLASRMEGVNKTFAMLGSDPVFLHSVLTFCALPEVLEVIVVMHPQSLTQGRLLCKERQLPVPCKVVAGGNHRQQSAYHGFLAASPLAKYIAIHDGARPLVSETDVKQVFADARNFGAAVLGGRVNDTVKQMDGAGQIVSTVDRTKLCLAQTPQVFLREDYGRIMRYAMQNGLALTDDSGLMESQGIPVVMTMAEHPNFKITTREDLQLARDMVRQQNKEAHRTATVRVGHGYDVHCLVEGRRLVLGGVEIPHFTGLLGHSDADVLLHAIMDSLLGAAALGDIGQHFPDTDQQYEGASSLTLLGCVCDLIAKQGYQIGNIDATIVAQEPKLSPYLEQMRELIASYCHLAKTQINIKATTEETLGFTGAQEGIAAHCVTMLLPQ